MRYLYWSHHQYSVRLSYIYSLQETSLTPYLDIHLSEAEMEDGSPLLVQVEPAPGEIVAYHRRNL